MKRFDLILKIIQNNPGIHIRGIIKETGLENGVVMHYLEKLDKQGKIKSKKYTRYKRYYSLDIDEDEYDIIRNLRKPTKKEILLFIVVKGSARFKEILSKIHESFYHFMKSFWTNNQQCNWEIWKRQKNILQNKKHEDS